MREVTPPVRAWIAGACIGLVGLLMLGLLTLRTAPSGGGRTEALIAMLDGACKTYRQRYGKYPPSMPDGTSAILVRLMGVPREVDGKRIPPILELDPSMLGPELPLGRAVLDEWGRPIRYMSPSARDPQAFDLWSTGHDALDPSDDITNWAQASYNPPR